MALYSAVLVQCKYLYEAGAKNYERGKDIRIGTERGDWPKRYHPIYDTWYNWGQKNRT